MPKREKEKERKKEWEREREREGSEREKVLKEIYWKSIFTIAASIDGIYSSSRYKIYDSIIEKSFFCVASLL